MTKDHVLLSYSFGNVCFSILSNSNEVSLSLPKFSAFASNCTEVFATLKFVYVNEIDATEKSFTEKKQKSILETFSYPSIRFEVPCWSSLILNIPSVRQYLNSCYDHGKQVTLEIRRETLVITDYLKHTMTIFYSKVFFGRLRVEQPLLLPFLHDINALMIHCSCVNFGGKAAVFVAMDEGGKTTAASLCKNGKVLSDDQILFRKQDTGKWLAYGTPFTTFTPDPIPASPMAFFLLEKSDKFSLTKLSSRELLAHLWNEHSHSRILIPKMYHTKILDLYISLSSSAPVYLMKFPKDYIDQEAILKCLDH